MEYYVHLPVLHFGLTMFDDQRRTIVTRKRTIALLIICGETRPRARMLGDLHRQVNAIGNSSRFHAARHARNGRRVFQDRYPKSVSNSV